MKTSVTIMFLTLLLSTVCVVWLTPSCSRSLGLAPSVACPLLSLTPGEIEARFRRGVELSQQGRVGDHFRRSSIESGLPILRDAVNHGHVEAIEFYRSLLTQAGILDMRSIGGLSAGDASAEALMWELVMIHRGFDEVPTSEEQRYAVLLDPSLPIPENYYDDLSGLGWSFQMMTDKGVEWSRMQAFIWKGCWSKREARLVPRVGSDLN